MIFYIILIFRVWEYIIAKLVKNLASNACGVLPKPPNLSILLLLLLCSYSGWERGHRSSNNTPLAGFIDQIIQWSIYSTFSKKLNSEIISLPLVVNLSYCDDDIHLFRISEKSLIAFLQQQGCQIKKWHSNFFSGNFLKNMSLHFLSEMKYTHFE